MSPLLSRVSNSQGIAGLSGFRRAFLGRSTDTGEYIIPRSLRFNDSDTAYLSRVPSSNGDRQKFTFSFWMKRTNLVSGGTLRIFHAGPYTAPNYKHFYIRLEADTLTCGSMDNSATYSFTRETNAKLRDPSAWYHIVIAVNSTLVNASDRAKIYINGVEQTYSSAINNWAQNDLVALNSAGEPNYIGARHTLTSEFLPAYIADFRLIDGQALAPTDFGKFDATTGVWNPIRYAGTYGTNGYHLPFNNLATPTTVAEDASGQNNHWTAYNITTLGQASYSSDVITGTSSVSANYSSTLHNPSNMGINSTDTPNKFFDGSTSTGYLPTNYSNPFAASVYFTINKPCTSSLRIWISASQDAVDIFVDGEQVRTKGTGTNGTWNTCSVPSSGFIGTLQLKINGGDYSGFNALEIDGTVIADSDSLTKLTLSSSQNLTKFHPGYYLTQDDYVTPFKQGNYSQGWSGANAVDIIFTSGASFSTVGNTKAVIIDTTLLPSGWSLLFTRTGGANNLDIYHGDAANGSDVGAAGISNPSSAITAANNLKRYITAVGSGGGNVDFTISGTTYGTEGAGHVGAVDTSANTVTFGKTTGTWSTNTSNYLVGQSTLSSTADTDTLLDSPTNGDPTLDTGLGGELSGNYATLNPLAVSSGSPLTLSNGNLEFTCPTTASRAYTTATLSIGEKTYWEMLVGDGNTQYTQMGIVPVDEYNQSAGNVNLQNQSTNAVSWFMTNGIVYKSTSAVFTTTVPALGDLVSMAFDPTNGNVYCWVNGVAQNSGNAVATVDSSKVYIPAFLEVWNTQKNVVNFGQRPFSYQAPTGFKCLCTANLPEPTIADGSTAMDVSLYTGNSPSTQTISGFKFSPDLVWIKDRDSGSGHRLTDTVRGATKALESYDTTIEATEVNGLTAFTSDGFTVGSQSHYNSGSLVAWSWDAGTPPTRTHTQPAYYSSTTLYTTAADVVANATARSGGDSITNEYVYIVTNSGGRIGESVFSTVGTLTSPWYMLLREGGSWVNYGSYSGTNPLDFEWKQDFVANISTYTCANNVELHMISSGTSPAQISVTLPTLATTTDDGAVANTNGSIESRVKANTAAGFSITKITSTGLDGTFGHGLSSAPSVCIAKSLDSTSSWTVYTTTTGADNALYLNQNVQSAADYTFGSNSGLAPDDTLIYMRTQNLAASMKDIICYSFAPVEGYSAFGRYIGNELAEGPFVYLGFRPKLIITKAYGATSSWGIWDTSRDLYNPTDATLYPNLPNSEETAGAYPFDILSNGFKIRSTAAFLNSASGNIYFAWAENPFRSARAR